MTAVKSPARPKRVKSYFTSGEIAHQWAHQLVPHGRCPSSMSFTGPCFYSYSTVIARIIEHKGRRIYILDTHKYSITTSSHQSDVRRSIPHDSTIFYVDEGGGRDLVSTPKGLRDHYLKLYRAEPESKLERLRASHLLSCARHLDDAIRVCEVFGLGHKKLLAEREGLQPALETARELVMQWEKGRNERANKAAATRRANIVAAAEAFIADPENTPKLPRRDEWKLPPDVRVRYDAAKPAHERARDERIAAYKQERVDKYVADPINNERPYYYDLTPEQKAAVDEADERRNAGLLEAWFAGGHVRPLGDRAYLRRIGDVMETSLGVRVPIADAERAFRFISALRKAGKDWRRNGETFAIGQFQLDSVTAAGVIAGCHRVNWAEIDRFAKSQGWVVTE